MSKKSNPTVIGAFVVGAVVLLAGGVALFGGSELFAKREIFVAYFTEKTQGLRKGSNVTMNGAQIGYVSDTVLLINKDTFESITAVKMEIRPESWLVVSAGVALGSGLETSIPYDELIQVGGLRAQLQTESLVTGQLMVDITFQPDTTPVMRGGDNPPYPEIPTIPSNIQRIVANVQRFIHDLTKNFDPGEASVRLQSSIRGLDELANSQDLREAFAGANRVINREATQQLSASLQSTLDALGRAASDAGSLLRKADARLDTDLKPLIERIDGTLDEAQGALAAAKFQLRGDSTQGYELGAALREVEAAARAMREFLDYLDRNPEALLRGKKQ